MLFSAIYSGIGAKGAGGWAVGRAVHIPSVKEKALFDEALVTG